jgi:hypothetical protein
VPIDVTTYLASSHLSEQIRNTEWAVPAIQTVHILAVATLVGAALTFHMRLAGLMAVDEPGDRVARRFVGWIWGALLVLCLTGGLMVVSEPDRTLHNPVFWSKMAGVVSGALLTCLFDGVARRNPGVAGAYPAAIRGLAIGGLLLWTAVILAGRWIAYVY